MTAAAFSTLLLDAVLQQAAAHHQAGQLQEAEQLYRAILQAQPDHSDVNHNLGVLLGQTGRPEAGLLRDDKAGSDGLPSDRRVSRPARPDRCLSYREVGASVGVCRRLRRSDPTRARRR